MQNFTHFQQLFKEHIATYRFPEKPINLYEPCNYILQLGGKRVRPVLCFMANELFGDINPNTYHAATAIELFHNFTLIHDDIMDNAPIRRGMETVHEKWDIATAILAGDVMNVYAYDSINKIDCSNFKTILQVFNTTSKEVCEGQQMDMDFEKADKVPIDKYIEMISLKTSVLLAASLKIGALLGGATVGAANTLYEFGKNVGIAFQLKDDYLDAFGDSKLTGKQVGGDILANKKTYLLLKAMENANPKQKQLLEYELAAFHENKVQNTLAIFNELQIKTATENAIQQFSNLAFEHLAKLPIKEERKAELKKVALYLLDRDN